LGDQVVDKFYTAFKNGDAEAMIACYDDNVEFTDPAFGNLQGDKAKAMWRMLLSSGSDPEVSFSDVSETSESGEAKWEAKYEFAGKPVHNKVTAKFTIKDGKIIKHVDTFDFWTWSSQALGLPGKLLGWTSFLNNKVSKGANAKLDKFMAKTAPEVVI